MKLNKIYNENCLDTMAKMPDEFVYLTVTSPPYDNLRTYNDNIDESWNDSVWKPIIKELHRVTKQGGVVVWVVGDATINGSETGTSFKQALWAMECGFNLHDTMIYEKNSSSYPSNSNSLRYTQIYEYMFIFSKNKPLVNLICDKKNKWAGHKDFSGKLKKPVPDFSPRNNIWKYTTSFNGENHPAPFPEQLAADHIRSWSNEGDTVYDPFMGSGTTAKMAHILKRNWIGSELSKEYVNLANKRLDPILRQTTLF
jgi:site-specific DNA-methyltransferase (adenine-specific)